MSLQKMKPKKLAFKKLEEYGIIGNLETCALVGNDGSIDWCCLPNIDSPSVFAAILDLDKGGFFRIGPSGRFDSHQAYIGSTNVLTTTFDAADGSATLTDFMPVFGTDSDVHRAIMRKLFCTRGKIRIEVEFEPKFDYGRDPGRRTSSGKTITAGWQDLELFLKSPIPIRIESGALPFSFELKEGDTRWFALGYGDAKVLDSISPDELLDRTCRFWRDWLHGSAISRPLFQGPWKDLVARSALLLKLLAIKKIRSGDCCAYNVDSGINRWYPELGLQIFVDSRFILYRTGIRAVRVHKGGNKLFQVAEQGLCR